MKIFDIAGRFLCEIDGDTLTGANLHRADLTGANLHKANGIIAFGPCPSPSGRIGHIVASDDGQTVYLGCWQGGIEHTCKRIIAEYPGPIGDAYAGLVRAASVALASRTVKAQGVEA